MIFHKTSSCGNDFIEIDAGELPSARPRRPLGGLATARPRRPLGGLAAATEKGELARRVCDRQRGIGADGVVYYRAGRQGRGPCRFEIFNRDGGAAELSGNGMAGLAAVLLQRRLGRSPLVLEAGVGRRRVELVERRGPLFVLDVEIGVPDFSDRAFFPFLDGRPGAYVAEGLEFHPVAVGNPHAVIICREMPPNEKLAALGERIEGHAMFPKRVNVEFVLVSGTGACRVYFFERGVGPTPASATGSAAVFAVLRRLGLAQDRLAIELGGSDPLHVAWADGITVRSLTRLVCRGEYFL